MGRPRVDTAHSRRFLYRSIHTITRAAGQHTEAVVARFNNSTQPTQYRSIESSIDTSIRSKLKHREARSRCGKLTYQRLGNDTYEVNVPVEKTFETYEGEINQIKGYIVHLKLSPTFKVYSYHETKPYPEAP